MCALYSDLYFVLSEQPDDDNNRFERKKRKWRVFGRYTNKNALSLKSHKNAFSNHNSAWRINRFIKPARWSEPVLCARNSVDIISVRKIFDVCCHTESQVYFSQVMSIYIRDGQCQG